MSVSRPALRYGLTSAVCISSPHCCSTTASRPAAVQLTSRLPGKRRTCDSPLFSVECDWGCGTVAAGLKRGSDIAKRVCHTTMFARYIFGNYLLLTKSFTCWRLITLLSYVRKTANACVNVRTVRAVYVHSQSYLLTTHSLFHSRLKSFLFCKSSLLQPFLFLIQVSLYGFPRLFTVTSEHIRLFTF